MFDEINYGNKLYINKHIAKIENTNYILAIFHCENHVSIQLEFTEVYCSKRYFVEFETLKWLSKADSLILLGYYAAFISHPNTHYWINSKEYPSINDILQKLETSCS